MKNFNGFFLDEENAKINSLAQLTLYSSLKSYFKTADDVSSFFHRYINIDDTERNGNLKSAPEYVIDACDSIIHFQHFLELYVKDILKSIHPLLVYDLPKSNKKHMILYDLIKGNKVKNAILENVYFIEFSCAYERLKELIKALKIEKYTFLLKHFDMMKEVNNLRNRTQHRGLFVLEYFELDRLFGEHIFPFLIAMQEYDDNYKDVLEFGIRLNYKNQLYNEISTLSKIKNEDENKLKKFFVYKMMMYAAFNNKIPNNEPIDLSLGIFDSRKLSNSFYEEMRKKEFEKANASFPDKNIKKCPVCGCDTLIEEEDSDITEDAHGNITDVKTFTCAVHCNQCGFHLEGIDLIKDLNRMSIK